MTYQLNRVKANTKFEINISQIIKDKKTIAMKTKTMAFLILCIRYKIYIL